MIALPAGARPLSEPHPLLALEKNNLRADAQLRRDGHEHRRRVHIHAEASSPARSGVLNQYRATYPATETEQAESISPVKADEAALVEQSAPDLPRATVTT